MDEIHLRTACLEHLCKKLLRFPYHCIITNVYYFRLKTHSFQQIPKGWSCLHEERVSGVRGYSNPFHIRMSVFKKSFNELAHVCTKEELLNYNGTLNVARQTKKAAQCPARLLVGKGSNTVKKKLVTGSGLCGVWGQNVRKTNNTRETTKALHSRNLFNSK